MSTNERLLRLENAFVTLSELAIQANSRMDEQSHNSDERLDNHQSQLDVLVELASKQDERSRKSGERLDNHQSQLEILVELARNADERLNTQLSWLNELGASHANLESKVEALTDAQIRTEGALTNLAESQAKLAEAQAKLAEAQVKLAESQAKLAESQAHSDQRLDALIDIVRKRLNGEP